MSTEITKDSVLTKARELKEYHDAGGVKNNHAEWKFIHGCQEHFPSIISLLESTLAENERLREDNTNLRNYKEAQEIIDKAPSSLSHES